MTEAGAPKLASLERILGFTAFAAGSVDVISFATLGGILASAMTGNLAFLGYYLSRSSLASALGSAIALAGFVMGASAGTLLARGRRQRLTLRILLGAEFTLLAGAAALWFCVRHRNGSWGDDALILFLASGMGLQGITGKKLNLSHIPTIVFTSTLTNIIMALTETLASGKFAVPKDTRRQWASFLLYFCGALCAGLAANFHAGILIFLPLTSVGAALISLETGQRA